MRQKIVTDRGTKYHHYESEGDADPKENEELINKISEATGEEKKKLAWELAQNNFPMVYHIINKRFATFIQNVTKEDMVSDGMIGLYNACLRAKKDTKNKVFTVYACQYIFGYIMKQLKKNNRIVRFPANKKMEDLPEEIYMDATEYDTMIGSVSADQDEIFKRSDGSFCKEFLQDIKEYYNEACGRKGSNFFGGKTVQKVMEAMKEYKEPNTAYHIEGISKQRIEQIRQGIFIYAIQTIRDANEKDKKELFTVLFSSKYSIDNPPPFTSWRKDYWNLVMSTDDYRSPKYYMKLKAGHKPKNRFRPNKNTKRKARRTNG